ncbi:hypothetical protein A2311_06390 [candidate division WOR-1 bacterium RIFOXYB2_FULL_48_7]|uniref:POTRA domain-containing protein n=1 Tax=candidate division WOR-1 bacterium RIFOXYB2_FULL_48_7 TaxID=1802583 RepID=A0A1F4TNV5_UNCSA|nr:MAG: hypothetical protein A2311_06390 [candidate division WOR-1 bacterium RIFOXYB2_FULL_48_7]
MVKKFWLVWAIMLILSCALWAEAVKPTIAAIEIRGNQAITQKLISDNVFSRVGEAVSEEKINGDIKAIYALGYFSNVTGTIEPQAGGNKLIITVTENPVLAAVSFEGNTVFSTQTLSALVSSRAGNVLNYQKIQDDIAKINELYKNKGYMLSRVADVDTDKDKHILKFLIIEGMVESIVLDGNTTTQDYVILRELKTKPGSVLNEETLKKDLRRVFNLGFFSEVTPNFEAGSSKDKIVLQLKIKETRSSTVNFGGGYGEREGWFGFVDLSINNLMGTAQGLLLRGQAGQQLSTYQFKYFNPWFFPEKFGDRTSFTFRRWLTIGRDIFVTTQDGIYNGFDVSFGKPLNDYYNASLTLGSENVAPNNLSTFEAYRADTVSLLLAFDTRDFWLNPKEGSYYTLELKQGFKTASTHTTFSKVGLDLNKYFPIFDNQVFAVHAGAGIGMGDVPVGELYWVGSTNTVRGYNPSEAHIGKYRLLGNLEYRLNFSDLFQGVFFYDYGNAWHAGGPQFDQFMYIWGPGVRVNTPLGPIRLDYGVGAGRSFSEGVMNFSIGQAF